MEGEKQSQPRDQSEGGSELADIMLADDCCSVAAILDADDAWRVPRLTGSAAFDPLLSVMTRNVAAIDGERHGVLRALMREGIVAAHERMPLILEQALSAVTLPVSGEVDLVQEFIAPTVFRVKAGLLGDMAQAPNVAAWTSRIFGGSWHVGEVSDITKAKPDFAPFMRDDRESPVVALWKADVDAGRMSLEEFYGTVLLFAVAGNDAIVGVTSRCLARVAEDSQLQASLRASPGVARSRFVSQTIIARPPVRYTFRLRPGGGLTVISLSSRKSGGSCPAHGESLMIPFGRGAHACIGADIGIDLIKGLIDAALETTGWLGHVGVSSRHPNGMFDTYVELPLRVSAGSSAT